MVVWYCSSASVAPIEYSSSGCAWPLATVSATGSAAAPACSCSATLSSVAACAFCFATADV
eukprot:6515251-Prymnesium_polylepis.2